MQKGKTRVAWDSLKAWVDRTENRWKVLLLTVSASLIVSVFLEILMRLEILGWLKHLIEKSDFIGDIFFPETKPQWKDKVTALIPVIGLPVGFWLWHWRDRNVRDQITEQRHEVENHRQDIENQRRLIENQTIELEIQRAQLENQSIQVENQRRELNLKEFQEIQKQAAGLFDIDAPESAMRQLQISALHQLKPFLSEDSIPTFRVAAIELILAGHADAALKHMNDFVFGQKKELDGYTYYGDNLDPIAKERLNIIKNEFNNIFNDSVPLNNRNFDFIDLSYVKNKKKGENIQIRHSSMINSNLTGFDGEKITLMIVDLTSAKMGQANLSHSYLFMSNFKNAYATEVNFTGSDLNFVKFEKTFLKKAKFEGADLSYTRIDDLTNLEEATFDSKTKFAKDWSKLSQKQKQDIRSKWVSRGMIFME